MDLWHIATEPYGPEGEYGAWFTYALVLVPAAWFALSLRRARTNPAPWRDRLERVLFSPAGR
jgi:high-affinity iron transporter